MELSLPGAKMTWNVLSRERKRHGSLAPWSENTVKLSLSFPKNLKLHYIKNKLA